MPLTGNSYRGTVSGGSRVAYLSNSEQLAKFPIIARNSCIKIA
jgi:hypothetical protein